MVKYPLSFEQSHYHCRGSPVANGRQRVNAWHGTLSAMLQISEKILFMAVADRSHILQSLTEEKDTLIVFLEGPCSAALTAGQYKGTFGSWLEDWPSCQSYHSDHTRPKCFPLPGKSFGAPKEPSHSMASEVI